MIPMIIDEPLIEDGVGILGGDDFVECIIMRVVNNGMAICLARVRRPRLQNFASLLRLRYPDRCRRLPRAIVEVEQHYFVTGRSEPGHGAATAILWVARVATGNHDLEFPWRLPHLFRSRRDSTHGGHSCALE